MPFSIDEARLSYAIQFTNEKLVEILAVVIARPILEDYERIFLDAGYRLGMVLPSIVATLPLCDVPTRSVTLLAKATGFTLSVVLLEPGRFATSRGPVLQHRDPPRTPGRLDAPLGLVGEGPAHRLMDEPVRARKGSAEVAIRHPGEGRR